MARLPGGGATTHGYSTAPTRIWFNSPQCMRQNLKVRVDSAAKGRRPLPQLSLFVPRPRESNSNSQSKVGADIPAPRSATEPQPQPQTSAHATVLPLLLQPPGLWSCGRNTRQARRFSAGKAAVRETIGSLRLLPHHSAAQIFNSFRSRRMSRAYCAALHAGHHLDRVSLTFVCNYFPLRGLKYENPERAFYSLVPRAY